MLYAPARARNFACGGAWPTFFSKTSGSAAEAERGTARSTKPAMADRRGRPSRLGDGWYWFTLPPTGLVLYQDAPEIRLRMKGSIHACQTASGWGVLPLTVKRPATARPRPDPGRGSAGAARR